MTRGINAQSEPSWPNAVPVSLEAGGGILCRPNQAVTLLVCFSLDVAVTGSILCCIVYCEVKYKLIAKRLKTN